MKLSNQSVQMHRAKTIRIVGQDPSLRNWGIAIGTYNLETGQILIEKLYVVCAELPTGKQVRQNSSDLEASRQLYLGAVAASEGAHATFVEVPVGSQSARAMCSYGVAMGVLGAMRANDIPFFEVTPNEVKLAGAGHTKAKKKEMITWAMAKHPEAPWPFYKEHGKLKVSEAKAEHMADAIAAIYAGIASNPFKQLMSLMATQTKKENECKFN